MLATYGLAICCGAFCISLILAAIHVGIIDIGGSVEGDQNYIDKSSDVR